MFINSIMCCPALGSHLSTLWYNKGRNSLERSKSCPKHIPGVIVCIIQLEHWVGLKYNQELKCKSTSMINTAVLLLLLLLLTSLEMAQYFSYVRKQIWVANIVHPAHWDLIFGLSSVNPLPGGKGKIHWLVLPGLRESVPFHPTSQTCLYISKKLPCGPSYHRSS